MSEWTYGILLLLFAGACSGLLVAGAFILSGPWQGAAFAYPVGAASGLALVYGATRLKE